MRTQPGSSPSLPGVLAQTGGAILGGLILAPLLALGVSQVLVLLGVAQQPGMGLLSVQLFTAIIGFGAGAGFGAVLAGRLMSQPGNMWLAVASGAVTAVLVILVIGLLGIGGLGGMLWAGLLLSLAAAVGGYNVRLGR